MEMSDIHTQLIAKLAEELGPATAQHLVACLAEAIGKPSQVEGVSLLLDELTRGLAESRSCRDRIVPRFATAGSAQRCRGLAGPWDCVGRIVRCDRAQDFKESPLVLGLIESPSARSSVLKTALELAEQDANVALEFLRVSPDVVTVISADQLGAWLEIGFELTQVDFVVALEYIRRISAVARVLPSQDARAWAAFGLKLISQNSFGKTDYFGTIEFLRTSPLILGDLEDLSVRTKVVMVGSLLAERDAKAGIAWLAESPRLLRAVPNKGWRIKVLQYGALVAERDADTALAYLRRAPELVRVIGESAGGHGSLRGLVHSRDGRPGLQRRRSRHFVLIAAGAHIGGNGVKWRAPSSGGSYGEALRARTLWNGPHDSGAPRFAEPGDVRAATVSQGRAHHLVAGTPPPLSHGRGATRLYLVMAAHEAGHVEFGTYQLTLEPLADFVKALQQKYSSVKQAAPDTLATLFRLYPHPGLIQDLWMLVEDARVEFLLQREYPGLQRDLHDSRGRQSRRGR